MKRRKCVSKGSEDLCFILKPTIEESAGQRVRQTESIVVLLINCRNLCGNIGRCRVAVARCTGSVSNPDIFERLRIFTWVERGQTLPTVTDLWEGANWYEREIYDLFGRRIFSTILITSDGMSVDVRNMPSGTYCILMGSNRFLFVKG